MLLRVVVVAGGDDLRAADVRRRPEAQPFAALFDDAFHLTVVLEPNALFFGHLDHAVHDAVHAAHGIPRAEGGVRVVHQAVQRRCVLRFGPEEEDGELHQFDQPRVLEVSPDVVAEASQQLQPWRISQDVEPGEFEGVVGGLVDEAAHADVVFDLGLLQERVQLGPGARFNGLEGLGQGVRACRNVKGAIGKFHTVGGVEANEVVEVRDGLSELREVPVKHVEHPVPAGAHVEPEPLGFESPGAATGVVVAFEDGHVESAAGERGRSGEAGKSGSDDGDVEEAGAFWVMCPGSNNPGGGWCSRPRFRNKVLFIGYQQLRFGINKWGRD